MQNDHVAQLTFSAPKRPRRPITRSIMLIAAAAASLVHVPALACSCVARKGTEQEQVQAEFAEAKHVFIARVIAAKRAHSDRYFTEEAELKITQVLKGPYKVGQVVQIRSTVGGGMCGRSVRGDEPASTPVAKLGEWLIYSFNDGPQEISNCDRSSPLATTRDLEILKSASSPSK